MNAPVKSITKKEAIDIIMNNISKLDTIDIEDMINTFPEYSNKPCKIVSDKKQLPQKFKIHNKMNIHKYKTESARTFADSRAPLDQNTTDLLHCAIGASTEAGELLDAFKKHIYYKKPLDVVNVGEEIADIFWYLTNLCRLLDLDMETLMQNNINKLRKRFPDKFTSENALNRNLEAERKELEK